MTGPKESDQQRKLNVDFRCIIIGLLRVVSGISATLFFILLCAWGMHDQGYRSQGIIPLVWYDILWAIKETEYSVQWFVRSSGSTTSWSLRASGLEAWASISFAVCGFSSWIAKIVSNQHVQLLRVESKDENPLKEFIDEYRWFKDDGSWRARTDVDKRLINEIAPISISRLKAIYAQAPNDRERAMAVAVALGLPHSADDDKEASDLLVKLLHHKLQRVRYRAAASIARRGQHTDTSQKARDIMMEGIQSILKTEGSDEVIGILEKALHTLTISR